MRHNMEASEVLDVHVMHDTDSSALFPSSSAASHVAGTPLRGRISQWLHVVGGSGSEVKRAPLSPGLRDQNSDTPSMHPFSGTKGKSKSHPIGPILGQSIGILRGGSTVAPAYRTLTNHASRLLRPDHINLVRALRKILQRNCEGFRIVYLSKDQFCVERSESSTKGIKIRPCIVVLTPWTLYVVKRDSFKVYDQIALSTTIQCDVVDARKGSSPALRIIGQERPRAVDGTAQVVSPTSGSTRIPLVDVENRSVTSKLCTILLRDMKNPSSLTSLSPDLLELKELMTRAQQEGALVTVMSSFSIMSLVKDIVAKPGSCGFVNGSPSFRRNPQAASHTTDPLRPVLARSPSFLKERVVEQNKDVVASGRTVRSYLDSSSPMDALTEEETVRSGEWSNTRLLEIPPHLRRDGNQELSHRRILVRCVIESEFRDFGALRAAYVKNTEEEFKQDVSEYISEATRHMGILCVKEQRSRRGQGGHTAFPVKSVSFLAEPVSAFSPTLLSSDGSSYPTCFAQDNEALSISNQVAWRETINRIDRSLTHRLQEVQTHTALLHTSDRVRGNIAVAQDALATVIDFLTLLREAEKTLLVDEEARTPLSGQDVPEGMARAPPAENSRLDLHMPIELLSDLDMKLSYLQRPERLSSTRIVRFLSGQLRMLHAQLRSRLAVRTNQWLVQLKETSLGALVLATERQMYDRCRIVYTTHIHPSNQMWTVRSDEREVEKKDVVNPRPSSIEFSNVAAHLPLREGWELKQIHARLNLLPLFEQYVRESRRKLFTHELQGMRNVTFLEQPIVCFENLVSWMVVNDALACAFQGPCMVSDVTLWTSIDVHEQWESICNTLLPLFPVYVGRVLEEPKRSQEFLDTGSILCRVLRVYLHATIINVQPLRDALDDVRNRILAVMAKNTREAMRQIAVHECYDFVQVNSADQYHEIVKEHFFHCNTEFPCPEWKDSETVVVRSATGSSPTNNQQTKKSKGKANMKPEKQDDEKKNSSPAPSSHHTSTVSPTNPDRTSIVLPFTSSVSKVAHTLQQYLNSVAEVCSYTDVPQSTLVTEITAMMANICDELRKRANRLPVTKSQQIAMLIVNANYFTFLSNVLDARVAGLTHCTHPVTGIQCYPFHALGPFFREVFNRFRTAESELSRLLTHSLFARGKELLSVLDIHALWIAPHIHEPTETVTQNHGAHMSTANSVPPQDHRESPFMDSVFFISSCVNQIENTLKGEEIAHQIREDLMQTLIEDLGKLVHRITMEIQDSCRDSPGFTGALHIVAQFERDVAVVYEYAKECGVPVTTLQNSILSMYFSVGEAMRREAEARAAQEARSAEEVTKLKGKTERRIDKYVVEPIPSAEQPAVADGIFEKGKKKTTAPGEAKQDIRRIHFGGKEYAVSLNKKE